MDMILYHPHPATSEERRKHDGDKYRTESPYINNAIMMREQTENKKRSWKKRKRNLSIVYGFHGRNEREAKHSQEFPALTCRLKNGSC